MKDKILKRFTLFCFFALLLSGAASASPFFQDSTKSVVIKDTRFRYPRIYFPNYDMSNFLQRRFQLTRKASAGDPTAMHELGLRFLTGQGFVADTLKSAYWISRAALLDHITARYNLGIFYANGWGTEWNPFEAFRHFLFAAERGMAQAQYAVGISYTENLVVARDLSKAREWVEKAAGQDFEPAEELLPKLTESIARKEEKEPEVSEEVKEASRPPVNSPLVYLDFTVDTLSTPDDSVVVADLKRQFEEELLDSLNSDNIDSLFTAEQESMLAIINTAADAGSPEALTFLGRMYETGKSVEQDEILAAVYYLRAMRVESFNAPRLLWELVRQRGYYQRLKSLIDQGDENARYVWAGTALIGFDMLILPEQAIELLEQNAEAGHIPSIIDLGISYYLANPVPADHEKALAYWTQAANIGSLEAEVRIAVSYLADSPDPAEYSFYIPLLREAENLGSIHAQVALGYCYENGIGLDQDIALAADQYRKAAFRGSLNGYHSLTKLYNELRPDEDAFRVGELR